MKKPNPVKGYEYSYDAFKNGEVLLNKKKNHLPAMGWNSWNAFGSGNTEELTKAMADKIVELGLDKLGYKYVVLDDGCYLPERVDGLLGNEPVKFPGGFKALSDYIHAKGLKFGMYNDIGTNLCAGAAVGTCGHETEDARTYVGWGVDFLKVDNCYYLWDNATFSDPKNASYVYTPGIIGIKVKGTVNIEMGVEDACVIGNGVLFGEEDSAKFAYSIGTFDGTGPAQTPQGDLSGELRFEVEVPSDGNYDIEIECLGTELDGVGRWIQVAVEDTGTVRRVVFDDMLEEFEGVYLCQIKDVFLKAGKNSIFVMNHRRQENTLASYARLLEGLNLADPGHDVILSICEWGKTQPHCWGYKVGDSWRILNDITFNVGSDGNPGKGNWTSDYTTSVTAQYNKCVIMDEFCGLDKGWNDPDMLMIGMDGLDMTMNRTHMTMWCMMNAPLMLGLDLRRVSVGDELWQIIANKDLIDLNQDSLGIAAKRVKSVFPDGTEVAEPSSDYVVDNNRVDVLVKPLADGRKALSIINLSENTVCDFSVDVSEFFDAKIIAAFNVWTKETLELTDGVVSVGTLPAHDNYTLILG